MAKKSTKKSGQSTPQNDAPKEYVRAGVNETTFQWVGKTNSKGENLTQVLNSIMDEQWEAQREGYRGNTPLLTDAEIKAEAEARLGGRPLTQSVSAYRGYYNQGLHGHRTWMVDGEQDISLSKLDCPLERVTWCYEVTEYAEDGSAAKTYDKPYTQKWAEALSDEGFDDAANSAT